MSVRWAEADEIARAGALLPHGAAILVVGASDTGKSTLLRQVAVSLSHRHGLSVGLVDADIGQSEIATPGSIGMHFAPPGALAESPRAWKPAASAFIGATSPARHVLEWVTGTVAMVRAASAAGADRILIDTPGYITGRAPKAMLRAVVDLAAPAMIVAMSRTGEIEPLLGVLAHLNAPPLAVRVPVSPDAHARSRTVRAAHRAARFQAHLAGAHSHTIGFDDIALIGTHLLTGEPQPAHIRKFVGETLGAPCLHAETLPGGGVHSVLAGPARRTGGTSALEEYFRTRGVIVTPAESYEGLLCGLVDAHRTAIEIALIEHIDFAARRTTLFTPLRHHAAIAQAIFGAIRLRPDGREIASVAPGTV